MTPAEPESFTFRRKIRAGSSGSSRPPPEPRSGDRLEVVLVEPLGGFFSGPGTGPVGRPEMDPGEDPARLEAASSQGKPGTIPDEESVHEYLARFGLQRLAHDADHQVERPRGAGTCRRCR